MIIDIEALRKCNEEGKFEFTHLETGQDFVLLTKEKYQELEEKAP